MNAIDIGDVGAMSLQVDVVVISLYMLLWYSCIVDVVMSLQKLLCCRCRCWYRCRRCYDVSVDVVRISL